MGFPFITLKLDAPDAANRMAARHFTAIIAFFFLGNSGASRMGH
jgi:hypothetical protein